MAYYEHVFIARQDLSEPQVNTLRDDLKKILSDNKGKVTKEEYWGLRTLAYKIKKNKKGHYVLMNIDAPSAAVQEMERLIRHNDDILRHLTVAVDELDTGPSVMMQKQSDDRPDRSGGFDRHDRHERKGA